MGRKGLKYFFIATIAIIFLSIFPSFTDTVNYNIFSTIKQISGSQNPDSNIVLIEITENDIANLGGWPLKRSYYALILENLIKLKAKRVGLEIFLSESISSQNIYTAVLLETISKNRNIVLGSVLNGLENQNDAYYSAEIIFPEPKIKDPNIETGHLNFIEKKGILIPYKAESERGFEYSFSAMLTSVKNGEGSLKLNILSSWKKFTRFSLIDFFEYLEEENEILSKISDKIVIVGVSDPLIAKSIGSEFDENLPGMAIHAFAADNMLNQREINDYFLKLSTVLFFIFILIVAYLRPDFKAFFIFIFTGLIISFFLWKIYYVQVDYSALLVPSMFLIGAVLIFNFLENRRLLNMSKEESKILKMNLMEKESHLSQLKSEIAKQKKKPSEALLMKIQNLESEIENLRKQEADDKQEYLAGADYHIFEGIVYKSRGMDKIVDIIKRVAPENASVLITGESGSGKELIAKAIHNLSKRKDSNFVAVNCAALPENLLESELFGHVKGAFTGAVNDKAGRFQEADKGTLFLDEIGETTDNFQAKLLRVIQSGEFQKVGSSKTDKVDVRIVAATNKNLSRSIKENRFREDLFYRLNVINIDLPPLSERSEDISVIADYFVKKEDPDLSISRAVMNKLSENEWKGNIRELESVIKRAVIFAKTDNRKIVMLKDLPEPMSKISKDDMETLVLQSLRNKKFSHSSITETADELSGVSRTVVSENFRGILFRAYTENSFDIEKTVKTVTASSEIDVLNKVNSKLVTYLSNLDKDLEQIKDLPFEDIKRNFSSKYKNLPQKYHVYLDIIIKNKIGK